MHCLARTCKKSGRCSERLAFDPRCTQFYSLVGMGRRTWQRRHFVLDDAPTHPLRYHRLSPAGEPLLDRFGVVDLYAVRELELGSHELRLLCEGRRVVKLRCDADAPASLMQATCPPLPCHLFPSLLDLFPPRWCSAGSTT